MIKKFEISRQKLFDGAEEKCLEEIFEIRHQKIRLTDFYNNPLRDLKKEIDEESFNTIVKGSKFSLTNSFIEKYTSEDGLEVNYLKNNNFINLFSYGEYQAGRYLLFLENIWLYSVKKKMDKEKFISKIQSNKSCHYIYQENERNKNTGLIKVWLYNGKIILTWEECPPGLIYDESTYTKDELHNFNSFEELEAFFNDHNILYENFSS
ncbi:hypothetical protein SAMN05443633_104338 [Chryseobacterium arachidis]|uniref:Uncharacterized protein n=1 Tax=Chryseobacterium arachidis TaxID=1416778 RepID=A0A1M5BYG1_9FLAO|nr:hypothetical protein [Chryseobacterium arachidis]SHF47558.1 hypothetical protein SAMN05443633_104338 [Chryseobacterium arachidis]